MISNEQRAKADAFLALHHGPELLVLPNAWDAVSARIYELEGFSAIGTTSGGVAASCGYPDGQRISLQEMAEAVRRMTRCVHVPISADLEAGYATTPDGVAEAAAAVLEAGAVGINLEDGTGDPADPLFDASSQVEKIAAVRAMADAAGVHLFINARVDVYLVSNDPPEGRLRETIRRASLYRQAGADGIFVPDTGALDAETIARLAKEIDAPLNVIAGEGTPPLHELAALGVARVSFGPRPMRATLALVRKIAREWKERGTYETMLADSLTYAEVNQMFEPGARGSCGFAPE